MKGGKMKKILFVLALLLILGVTNAYALTDNFRFLDKDGQLHQWHRSGTIWSEIE